MRPFILQWDATDVIGATREKLGIPMKRVRRGDNESTRILEQLLSRQVYPYYGELVLLSLSSTQLCS